MKNIGIGKVRWSQEVKFGKILNVQSFRIQYSDKMKM